MKRLAILVLALCAVWRLSAVTDDPPKKKRKPAAAKSKLAKSSKLKKPAHRRPPKPPATTVAQKVEAKEFVEAHAGDAMVLGLQNVAAMVPFFERVYQAQEGGKPEALHILQYGDSHTASDDWAGAIRTQLQARFGDGGPGYVHPGHPFEGYRRFDAKGTQSRGWSATGLLNREGDGAYGLSGVRLSTAKAGETLTLDASGTSVELFYWKQPGGGTLTIAEGDTALATVDTAATGAAEPGYWKQALTAGPHHLVLRTANDAPVTVFGWSVDNPSGVSWETLGINGAQADLLLLWNERLLASQIGERDPALIVLAYGTNEARRPGLTMESYRDTLRQVLRRLHAAAPAASILLIGAPDQAIRAKGRITPVDNVDHIIAAQREAALAEGCAFWNLRQAMGGKGSMKQWVTAGMGQGDFVHLTAPGYRLWGEAVAQLLVDNYSVYRNVRRQVFGNTENGSPHKTH